jgi:Tannase and feruloyl esterase
MIRSALLPLGATTALLLSLTAPTSAQTASADERAACAALKDMPNLTITVAEVREGSNGLTYCYVRGILPPAIGFHVQLPLKQHWNGRFLMWGDGGKDGDLDFADSRVAEGYAAANTNMGHDSGAEPGSSFGYDNRQAEIDFGYRAVHLTVIAGKTIVDAYYGRSPDHAYFEGCSTGGREGLMEAQRYPYDFDGIVAGSPAHRYQDLNAARTWLLQKMYADHFAGSLSFDTNGDGKPDSPRKIEMLAQAVLDKCDAIDGVKDGVIDNPPACDFDPARDLEGSMCKGDVNADGCFTRLQLANIEDFYRGAHDSSGHPVYPGFAPGSEAQWMSLYVPQRGNRYRAGALGVTGDHLNYLFYETDPGVAPPDLNDVSYVPDAEATPPEWAWWQFDIDDVTRGKGDLMKSITDANDPDLTRFLRTNGGKLILYHGWADALITPLGTVQYYKDMVGTTYGGDMDRAREDARLFMIPGMGHCGGGPGPNTWDKLPPLVAWVEQGTAPESVVAAHLTNGTVDNRRPIFPYPDQAVYDGPAGGANDAANWVPQNFRKR